MKPTARLRRFLLGSTLLAAQAAHAGTFYWDANGSATTAIAATGTWGTDNFWSTDSTGATATSAQTIDNTSDVVFSAASNSTGGIVTIGTTQAAHSITFDDATGAITLSGGTAISLGSSVAGSGIFFTSATGAANVISTPIILNSAATDIAITNSGTAAQTIGKITGSATSGTQTITIGTTNAATTGTITLNNTIADVSGSASKVALTINSSGGALVLLSAVNNTYSGDTTLTAGTLRASTGTSFTASNTLFGTSTLKLNGGTLSLLTGGATGSGVGNTTAETVTFGNNTVVGGTTTIAVGRTGASTAATSKTIVLGTLSIGANQLNVTGANSYALSFGATTLTGDAIFNPSTANLTLGAVGESGSHSLTKSGAGTLTLSAAGTYTGGTTINAGTLAISADDRLGTSGGITFGGNSTLYLIAGAGTVSTSRVIALNSSVTGTVQVYGGVTLTDSGKVTGDGNILFTQIGNGSRTVNLNSTANDFTGSIGIDIAGSGQNLNVNIASLADGSGYGNVRFGLVGAVTPTFTYTGSSPLTLSSTSRKIEFFNNGTGKAILSSSNAALNINSDLSVTGTGAKTLTLDAPTAISSTFGGKIADGSGTVAIAKTGVGTWTISGNMSNTGGLAISGNGTLKLSGTNTYSGATTTPTGLGGTLVYQGIQAVSPNSAITQNQVSTGGTQLRFLDSSAGSNNTASSAATLTLNTVNGSSISNSGNTIFVGNNGTANGGTISSDTTTGETISIGKLTMINNTTGGGSNWAGWGSIQGANGYSLLINSVDLPSTNNVTTGTVAAYFVPTTASVTLAGTIQQFNGNNKGNVLTLQLDGTNAANFVTGNILDAADFTDSSNATAKALNVTKSSTSTWTLSGTNTYTGSTAVSGGTLEIGGTGTLGSGNYAGAISIASTNSGTFKYNSSANQILGGVISGAGAFVKDGAGTLTLTNTNGYTGVTTVNGGTLEISATGSTNASSAVTVSNSGSALVVNGTINGTLVANVSTTVSGTGTVAGNAEIKGTHNPGNSPGIQTFGGDLAYTGGAAVVNWELGANTVSNNPNPTAIFDQILVGGNLDFTNLTTLNLSFTTAGSSVLWSDSLWDTTQSWTLYDVTGTTTNLSNLSLNTTNWLDSGSNAFDTARPGNGFSLSQSGNDVILTYNVVPEPNIAALLGGFGMIALLRRRR